MVSLSPAILCQELELESPAQVRVTHSVPCKSTCVFRSVGRCRVPACGAPAAAVGGVSVSLGCRFLRNPEARVKGTALRVTIVTNERFLAVKGKRHRAAVLGGKDPSFPHADRWAVMSRPRHACPLGRSGTFGACPPRAPVCMHTHTCAHVHIHTRTCVCVLYVRDFALRVRGVTSPRLTQGPVESLVQ